MLTVDAATAKIIKKFEDLDVVVVGSVRNLESDAGRYDMTGDLPVAWADPSAPQKMDHFVAVGGVDAMGRLSPFSPHTDWLVMAPGWNVRVADADGGGSMTDGNSYGELSLLLPLLL